MILEIKATELHQLTILLENAGLPTEGLSVENGPVYLLKEKERAIGGIALEICRPDGGLLRSLVVDASRQGKGQGQALVETLVQRATQDSLSALYLLTETAAPFFAKLGFETIDRSIVPQTLQQTDEFTSICPSSATVMRLSLD